MYTHTHTHTHFMFILNSAVDRQSSASDNDTMMVRVQLDIAFTTEDRRQIRRQI